MAIKLLQESIYKANQAIFEREYIVGVANKDKICLTEPVCLEIRYPDKRVHNIGIVHLLHLRGDWDDESFEKIAKTTDELTRSILARVDLYFDALKNPAMFHIDENGTIFNFNKKVTLHKNGTFSVLINDKSIPVTYKGKALLLKQIRSEDVIKFERLENGSIWLSDSIDKRKGKGLFINPLGEVYRA